MSTGGLEAFSDGVIAIIITIMVLALQPPHENTLAGLSHIAPIFSAYVLSFLYVAIYWNNHHHMMQTAERVNGAILWANLHLLFWLSLIPFATAWLGETGGATWPTAVYGAVLLAAAVAYYILQTLLVREHGTEHMLKQAIGRDWKGKLSPFAYLAGIVLAPFAPWLSQVIYVAVALIWLVPSRRIEKAVAEEA